uniref:Pirin n=1 Tax=Plectus sambesii TaxID=2011161 RepID=A0A914UHK5_9BILA
MSFVPKIIRRASERGVSKIDWLDSRHTFSFGDYSDHRFMGFGPLRVINDDRVKIGHGFDTHPHRDMEIITYVLQGAVRHKDSEGNGSVIVPNDVQVMSAGTGVYHSEFNDSKTENVHLLQIWIQPDKKGHQPRYQQGNFSNEAKRGNLKLVVSGDGRDGSMMVHRDVKVYAGLFDGKERAEYEVIPGRKIWLHVAKGSLTVNNLSLSEGDAIGVEEAGNLKLENGQNSEILLFDLN